MKIKWLAESLISKILLCCEQLKKSAIRYDLGFSIVYATLN